MRALLLLALLIPNSSLADQLQEKYDRYMSLLQSSSMLDANGFLIPAGCDGLIFTGLYGSFGGSPNLEAAMDPDGKWHRNPSRNCDGSTISRDQLTRLFWWLYTNKRLDLVDKTIEYGLAHQTWYGDWKMGDGDARTFIGPGLQSTLHEIRYRLGGDSHWKRGIPQVWTYQNGYESHLHIWHSYLRYVLTGQATQAELGFLKRYADREPRNGIYNAVYGKMSGDNTYVDRAAASAMDESLFPANALPTSENFCTDYLFQRDEFGSDGTKNPDWMPCPQENRQHPGTEAIITMAILLDRGPK